ncbi:MAG: Crotonobetainyl-CoA dehydrogenase [Myxococcota bacterium]|nr:Crotonobetainyl-CoA dehydrogenase [Myxococcota bacterium]
MSANFYTDNDDLRFYLERSFDWTEIVRLTERGYTLPDGHKSEAEAREFYRDILSSVGEYVAKEVAPRALAMDRKGNRLVNGEIIESGEFKQIFKGFREMGLYGMTAPRPLGGLNVPLTVYFAMSEMIARADVSVMTHFAFHGGIAMALMMYSLKEGTLRIDPQTLEITENRFAEAIDDILSGREWGCMVLTEPGAGSDLGAMRTRAVEKDGRWFLDGQKIFITSGHAQYQIVLAKTEEDKGDAFDRLRTLSLFFVPRRIRRDGKLVDNVVIGGLEEKMGHHGSATCTLNYDNSEGFLIGKRGTGFEQMLLLMNNARVGVGFEGVGIIEAAWRMARQYAAGRVTMGKPIERHELVADILDEMETTLAGLRALGYAATHSVELAAKLDMASMLWPEADETARARNERRRSELVWKARKLTPVFKYAASEWAVHLARMNMQVHGGMGYIVETGAEKLLRDALVMPVYEGASQIQAVMALKDNLGAVLKHPTQFVAAAARSRLNLRRARNPLERRVYWCETQLNRALQHIITRIAVNKVSHVVKENDPAAWVDSFTKSWDPKKDFSFGLFHAERLTRVIADVEMARLLMEQAQRFPERRNIAERFAARAESRVRFNTQEILHGSEHVLEQLARKTPMTEAA